MITNVVDPAPVAVARASTRHKVERLMALVGAILLVSSEIAFGAIAAGWAIAGLFSLGPVVMTVIDGIMLSIGTVFMVWFARNAIRAEFGAG